MSTGRFAPSPTAPLHVGNLRTALLAWLFARSAASPFLLRIEDLDPRASRPEHAAAQQRDLGLLGLDFDGEVVHQSARRDRYDEIIGRLVDSGCTYPCWCSRREIADAVAAPHEHLPDGAYPGTCRELSAVERARRAQRGRPAALRVRADAATAGFVDVLHGKVEGTVDDFVVRRNDGTPAYNLAVVVDDADAGVQQVVRGDDLLPGTPRQVWLGQRLGLPALSYAHVPLVLGPDGERLAKRHGAVTLEDLRAVGVSPSEVRSRLAASLGLAEPGEPVSMAALAERFDPSALPREPWLFVSAVAQS
jgi:glutamyl-tRNA synthetase